MKQLGLSMHGLMLADEYRNNALATAIADIVKLGDVVIDVGTGSGLLAMLAARAGAKRVYAIEHSSMAIAAKQLIEINGFSDSIKVIHKSSFQWEPQERADVILCETLGFSALDENFRATMIDARERMLCPNGKLLPSAVQILVAPVNASSTAMHFRLDNILGLKFAPLADVLNKAYQRRYIPYEAEIAHPAVLLDFDCYHMSNASALSSKVKFRIVRNDILTGFVLWFNANLAKGVYMENRRPDLDNHWGQTYLPLSSPLSVDTGMHVSFQLSINDYPKPFFLSWHADLL